MEKVSLDIITGAGNVQEGAVRMASIIGKKNTRSLFKIFIVFVSFLDVYIS